MIQLTDNIWIGNSLDENSAKVEVVLNVAKDLPPTRSWPNVEYIHIGLVDGPGNPLSTYYAALLALVSVEKKRVLVCCHEGKSRSVAVGLMYLKQMTGRNWDECLTILREQDDAEVIEPHEAHKDAFDRMDWELLRGAEC